MTEAMTAVEVCCDPVCENFGVQQVRPLTADEIADIERMRSEALAEQQKAEAEARAIEEAKASANAKLAALGLTAEEIAALSK